MSDELTVEKCLEELREMFPDWPSEITITTDGIFRVLFWSSRLATVKDTRSGRSLSEAMAQVRTFRQSQEQEQEEVNANDN